MNVLQAGSAEYLSKLLSRPGAVCPHVQKLIPGRKSGIPYRMGFFFAKTQKAGIRKWHESWIPSLESNFDNVLNLDTSKLCLACYHVAVPNGFATCSMPYNLEDLKENPRPRFNGLAKSGTEAMRYTEEKRRKEIYDMRERLLDEHERARRIRKLYRVNGVPEHLLLKDEDLPPKQWEPDQEYIHLPEDGEGGHW